MPANAASKDRVPARSGRPVCLLCYERDANHCHRKRIAEIICERTGASVEHLAAPLF
jgi:hypothetical protein